MGLLTTFNVNPQDASERTFAEKFLPWAQDRNVDFSDQDAVRNAINVFYGGGEEADLVRHTVADRPTAGWIYENGPYTMRDESVWNTAIFGGSPLMQWIPTNRMEAKEESIAYLDYVVPDGWVGGDYFAWLASLSIGACEYGPGSSWHGHEMSVGFGEWSKSTETLERYDFGLKQHRKTPILAVRGASRGLPMSNDAEWAVAKVAIDMERHHETILRWGVVNDNTQIEGLQTVIAPGYVQSHIIGGGLPFFSDPLYYDGTSLTTVDDLLKVIKTFVRIIIRRARQRSWTLGLGDMIVKVPAAMWPHILDAIACGSNTGCGNQPTGYTFRDVSAERQRFAQGGLGFGVLEVDGQMIPVMPDDAEGLYTLVGTDYKVVGDIQVLTRRVNGLPILEQQYLNWGMLDMPKGNWWTEQGGIVRAGWIDLNEKCWYAFSEMTGRLVSRMNFMQGIIPSVSMDIVMDEEIEQGIVYTDSYYALREQDPLTPWGYTEEE